MAEEQGQAVTQPALEALNPHEAVAALTQILEREESPPLRDDKGKFAKPEAQSEPEQQPPAEEKVEEPPEEQQPEITPEPRRFKLKYKGEELEKDEPEVIALAQQGFDYTQKSQSLAKERSDLDAKVKTEVEQRQKQYEEQLNVHRQAVLKLADPEALNADLNKLAAEDPVKAQQLFFKRVQIQQTLQAIESEQQKIVQQRESDMKAQFQKQAQDAVEALQTEIPGWSTDLYGKILKGAVEHYGFKQQEVNAITDPRAIKVLNDARLYREQQAAKPKTVDKRVASVPKVQKPGTAEKADPNASKFKEGMARLNQTGKREDAQALIAQMLESGRL